MATETLGAHLRNLLTPYSTLLYMITDIMKGNMGFDALNKIDCSNLDELIKFSYSDKMESTLWRNENE